MGQVYLAQDTSELDRAVAIKLLPAEIASDPKWMQRFIREARTVSALNHPNVLTIYEFGVHDSTRFMAMEYVDGVTLRDYLNGNRLNIHEVLDIGMQVAAALNAAHEAHVIHRDIKPENIMLRRRDGIVKVLDFGLAKPVKQSGDSGGTSSPLLTETGIVMGTISYMSPEQSLALKTLDYRTDIWSLGVVLYEMITGSVPFGGDYLWITSIGQFAFGAWSDWRNTLAGADPRDPTATDAADVKQCRVFDSATMTWSSDQCPHDGGIDQDIWGDCSLTLRASWTTTHEWAGR